MIIDILTGFPEFFDGQLNSSILRNALKNDIVEIWAHNLRHFTSDRHGKIDDSPYGGGAGMVMMAQPVFSCLDYLSSVRSGTPYRVFLTPQGSVLTQSRVREFANDDWLILLCGHYKDVDARVFERDKWIEVSIGDFIVSGGELPAAMLVDAIVRCLPGVLGDADSAAGDSFENGLLDTPYYTKPEEISGLRVPNALITGNHQEIEKWRNQQRENRTSLRRPDLEKH